MRTTVWWIRDDMRLADNATLASAVSRGGAVVPVYIHDESARGSWALGPAARWWLKRSLASLGEDLARAGSRLVIRSGDSATHLCEIVRTVGADAVVTTRRAEPHARAAQAAVAAALSSQGATISAVDTDTLTPPGSIRTASGSPVEVFTPYWRRAATSVGMPAPLAAPDTLAAPERWPASAGIDIIDDSDAPVGLATAGWTPGEHGALARARQFADTAMGHYASERDRPDLASTSRLSPHLHFGEIGVACVLDLVQRSAFSGGDGEASWVRQVFWREFGRHLLWHHPDSMIEPLQKRFDVFPWRDAPDDLLAWQEGRTGFPLVDAGMRELAATGWMHNRVRLVAASFLTKDLLVPWQLGARTFWDRLVDADLANNTLGWQWTAGCGSDAAPYFRVFNPSLQAERFDPHDEYVRRWVPEFGTDAYPAPMVDHREARRRALAAYASLAGI